MARVKLTISYLGTNYCGWQSQTNGDAIQDRVEQALSNYFGGEFVRVYGAGRTDVGVHAQGQVAHFNVDKPVNPFKLCLGVNLSLPSDIAVVDAQIVGDDFDARFSAQHKTYVYKLYVSPIRNPLLDIDHTQVYKPLDVDKMQQCANVLVGTHDFCAFQKTGSNLKGTVRTINSFNVQVQPNGTIWLVVDGNAFLYNQVRIMAGLLVQVGLGNFGLEQVEQMLNGTKLTFKTLPAKGLTLQKVFY